MTEESLQTLSKEQLFNLMIKTMDEILLLLKDPANEDKLDEKRHDMHLLRNAVDKIDHPLLKSRT